MRRLIYIAIIASLLLPCYVFGAEKGLKTVTGEVISIDLNEKAILIKKTVGRHEYINGGIVNQETQITVGGKNATLEDIKVKDTVTLMMKIENEDVYVKKIIKK